MPKPKQVLPPVNPPSVPQKAEQTDATNGKRPVAIPTVADIPGPLGTLHSALVREIVRPDSNVPEMPDHPSVDTFCAIVDGVTVGKDISPKRDEVTRALSNQPEKTQAVLAGLRDLDFDRLKEWVIDRNITEKAIHRLCRTSRLSSAEFLAAFQISNSMISQIVKSLISETPQLDSVTVTEKIDYNRQQAEKITQKKFAGTTPQGMEIIRKKLYALEKQMKARRAKQPTTVPQPA